MMINQIQLMFKILHEDFKTCMLCLAGPGWAWLCLATPSLIKKKRVKCDCHPLSLYLNILHQVKLEHLPIFELF